MKKVLGLCLVVFLGYIWLNDYTPNEGIGELTDGFRKEWKQLKKEVD